MKWRLTLLGLLTLASACEPDSLTSPRQPPGGYVLDAGVRRTFSDAGERTESDGGPWSIDAGEPLDAGSGRPDAGMELGCVCPQLPAQCTPAKVDVPLFTSEHTAQTELINLISCAEVSIQAALYEVDWSCISNALFERLARAPNLTVQLVIDDDRCPRDDTGKLTCALGDIESDPRVTIIDDSRSRYMHHKFWMVDGQQVWVGSANMTKTSFCTDFNDAWVLTDPTIVDAYAARFDTLFVEGTFGPTARQAALQSGPYTLHFGPQSPLGDAPSWYVSLLQSIGGARTYVDFAVFSLTRMDVALALIQAHQRGVGVRGLVHSRYSTEEAVTAMLQAGIPMRKGNLHTKLLIVDTASIATGTPNWSSNAWANNEDSLWINSSTVAQTYRAEFDRIFSSSTPL